MKQRIAGINSVPQINTGIRFQKHHLQNSFINSILAAIIGIGMYFVAKSSDEPRPELALWSVAAMIAMFFVLTGGEWLIGRVTNSNNRYIDNV